MRTVLLACFILSITTPLLSQEDEYLKEIVLECKTRTNCLDVNKANTQLLIGSENETVQIYDLIDKKTVFETVAHFQPVVKVQFSNQHDGFYTVGDRSFKLWINGNEKPEKIFTGSHTSITDWDMTPQEDFFVGGAYEKKFRYWDAINLTTPQTVNTTQSKNVISVAISNNNELVACGSLDHTIEIWKTDSLKKVLSIAAHDDPVCCLEFVNNDQYLISASHDGTAKLWDIETGAFIKKYNGHTQPISAIDVSPNGKYLLTASYDQTISLYAIATGDRIYRYKHHEAPVLDVRWNSAGDEFYSCDKEGQIVRWSVPKKIFVEYYFEAEMNKEVYDSQLFQPKRKGESRDEFKARQDKAEAFKQELIDKYYQKYLEVLKKKD